MDDNYLSTLITAIGILFAAIIGGFISIFGSSYVERRKWQRERQKELLDLRRKALTAALEWIEPMRKAEIQASSLLMAAIHGDIDYERFLSEFPNLLSELAKKDLSAELRAVLPDGIYARGLHIVRGLEEARSLGVKYGQEVRNKGKPLAGFQECSAKLDFIEQQINTLEIHLKEEFSRTFM
jgi:hypothetical protein